MNAFALDAYLENLFWFLWCVLSSSNLTEGSGSVLPVVVYAASSWVTLTKLLSLSSISFNTGL